jgi:chromosome partitioning protein
MRGLRRDRDKSPDQDKQQSPVEVEPQATDKDPGGDGSGPAVSAADGHEEAVSEVPADASAGSEPVSPTDPVVVPNADSEPAAATEPAATTEPAAAPGPEGSPQPVAAPAGEDTSQPVRTPQPVGEQTPQPEPEKAEKATERGGDPQNAPAAATEAVVASQTAADGGATSDTESEASTVGDPVEDQENKANKESNVTPAAARPLPRVIAVANQKGGVGKTTTAVNLGAALAELDFRVLVIDLDPQGNATTGLGIDARNFERSMYDVIMRDDALEDCIEPTNMKNLFVAPATIDLAGAEIELVPAFSRELKLKRAIETVIDDFDYVLIDCPPSLGLITVNGLAAAAEVLVPIQCEYYALEGLSQLLRNVHLVASNLNESLEVSTIVLTMYDARTKLSDQVATEVREHFGAKVCRNVIPRTVRLSEAPSFGQPISVFDPTSRGAIAYRELAKEVSGGAS